MRLSAQWKVSHNLVKPKMFDIFSFVFFFVVTTREGTGPSRKIIDNNFVYEQEVRARINKQGMCKVSF